MKNTERAKKFTEADKNEELPKGRIQSLLERIGLTPKTIIVLLVFSCGYIFLYVVVGSSCLGSIILVISFFITFLCLFGLLWTTCPIFNQKEKSEDKKISKAQQDAVTSIGQNELSIGRSTINQASEAKETQKLLTAEGEDK
ncbi:uncharacterized protein [Halyomorpha halys]|uniref:uncharacterized protein n=1 Tax=Halyomorpha halys TaxID=286706 RepID=UPI0006D50C79|nr:uncharacterized protein LOC106691369 [Halyomorpha halys]